MKRAARLLAAAVVGYGLAWSDRAYGHAPGALFCLVAGLSWLAGSAWTCSRSVIPLTLEVAGAHRERDLLEQERDSLAARVAQLEDGGTYAPVRLLPQQEQR